MSSFHSKSRLNNTRLNSTRRSGLRRGSMLIELGVSAAMLTAMLVILSQVIVQLHRHTKLVDRQLAAQQLLENMLEEAVRTPWKTLTTETLAGLKLPKNAQTSLRDAKLSSEVSTEAAPALAKRVTLRLTWQGSPSKTQPPLVLTTWVYKPSGETKNE